MQDNLHGGRLLMVAGSTLFSSSSWWPATENSSKNDFVSCEDND